MNSFKFKGISSDNFNVIVNSLPPITKPAMRVEETEIDGVDGTIIEDLGYESYEKKIKITITENNVDEIIKWLNGEGDLVLSNEPDKYYKAKVISQIDFESLIKYEAVEVTFRVQPFKYEYQEKATIFKNLLNITKQTTTENGVTFTNNGNGTFDVVGTATADTTFVLGVVTDKIKKNTSYFVYSSVPYNQNSFNISLHLSYYDNNNAHKQLWIIGNSIGIAPADEIELAKVDLWIPSGTTINEKNVKIIVDESTVKYDNLVVNNLGNYKAKPVMTITGTGTIGLLVNELPVFNYTFPDGEDTVVIDSQKQDAYFGTVLKNRNMIGEFPIFEIGENIITWEGVISSIKISSKSRWL